MTLQTDYTYDAVGNQLTRDAGGALETLSYDAASNRLETVTAGAAVRTLGYSASGNTASDDDGLGTVLTHIQDSTDRLVEVKNGAATVAQYLHNAKGQRVAKTVGASTTHYIHAGGALIAEADGATGATTAEYIAFNGIDLAYITTSGLYFVHADHLGTPQLLTDDTGAVVWDAGYRPFGEASVTGTLTFNPRFPGQYYDAETGLHYNMMRDYDSGLGRYVQSDPVGLSGGWNTYAYVGGNPVMRVDPRGQNAQDVWNMINLARQHEAPYDGETLALPTGSLDWFFGNIPNPGFYWPATDVITISTRWFPEDEQLCCEDLKLLYEVIVHESIHRTACWKVSSVWSVECLYDAGYMQDHVRNHKPGDAIYREGRRRAEKQYSNIESKYCSEDNGCNDE